MIKKVHLGTDRRGSAEVFRTIRSSGQKYILLPDDKEEDRYKIYWRYEENYLTSREVGSIHYKEFPWENSIVLTYEEIKDIHHSSRYVLIKDLPKEWITSNTKELLVV